MAIKFTLKETLEREGLTKYAVAQAADVRRNTITDLWNSNTRSLRMDTLDAILNTINKLSGKKYGIDAIVVYEYEDEDAH